MTQTEKTKNLALLRTEEGFSRFRALVQFIGVAVEPDVCGTAMLIVPGGLNVEGVQFKSLENAVRFMKKTKKIALYLVRWDILSGPVAILSDDSFSNAAGMNRQLIIAMLLADGQKQAIVVQCSSTRCHKAFCSALAVEVHVVVHAFGIDCSTWEAVERLSGRRVKLEAFIHSRSMFNVIEKEMLHDETKAAKRCAYSQTRLLEQKTAKKWVYGL